MAAGHLKFQSTLYLPMETTIHFSLRSASVTQVNLPFWKGAPCTHKLGYSIQFQLHFLQRLLRCFALLGS